MIVFLILARASAAFSQDHRLVLIEHFTGASCGSCPAGNRYIDSLVKLNPGKLITLKYQVNIPSYDPMYNDDSAQINQRMKYYGVSSAPMSYTDGTNKMYEQITQQLVDSLSQVPIHFHLKLQHAFSPGLDSISISLIIRSDTLQSFEAGKLRARIAVIEDSIAFIYPPGSNGEKIFKTVCKKLVPDPSGAVLPCSWVSGTADTLLFKILMPDYFHNLATIRVIAFVQDDVSKKVGQAAITQAQALPDYAGLDPVTSLNFPPLQCGDSLKNPKVTLWNLGTDTLKQALLICYPDTTSKADTVKWSGKVAPGLKQEVSFNSVYLENGGHSIYTAVLKPNNKPIINSTIAACKNVITIAITPVAPPIHEYFTSQGWPYPGWSVYNPNKDGNTWKRISYNTISSSYLISALQLRLFTMQEGTYNDFFLPLFDVSKMNSLKLGLEVAWCSNGNPDMSHDTIRVDVTTDCGTSWRNVLKKWATDIDIGGCGEFEFIGWLPDTSQWKKFQVDLSGESGSGKLLIRVRGIRSFSGNDMYVRNIFLGPDLGIDPPVSNPFFTVYPNPATDILKIKFPAGLSGLVNITVLNPLGIKVFSGQVSATPGDKQEYPLPIRGFINGIYLLMLESGKLNFNTKFIKLSGPAR